MIHIYQTYSSTSIGSSWGAAAWRNGGRGLGYREWLRHGNLIDDTYSCATRCIGCSGLRSHKHLHDRNAIKFTYCCAACRTACCATRSIGGCRLDLDQYLLICAMNSRMTYCCAIRCRRAWWKDSHWRAAAAACYCVCRGSGGCGGCSLKIYQQDALSSQEKLDIQLVHQWLSRWWSMRALVFR